MTDRRHDVDDLPMEIEVEIEVEIPRHDSAGVDEAQEPTPRPGSRRGNWGLAVLLGAVVAGGAVVAVWPTADDADGDLEVSAADADDGRPAIETIPPAEEPASTIEVPQPRSTQDWSLFDGVAPPTYSPVTDVGLVDLDEYDIDAAVDRLGEDVARQSTTRLQLGVGGYELQVTIERDPVADRYRVAIDGRRSVQHIVVDVGAGVSYVTVRNNDGEVTTSTRSNDELIGGGDEQDVRDLFDRLLVGPVRPDSFVPTSTVGRSVVTVGESRLTRQFLTVVDGSRVPEWQIYQLGPVQEFAPADRPVTLDYAVYVDDDARIVQVDGVSRLGSVTQLIEHSLIEPDAGFSIDIPTWVDDDEPESTADLSTNMARSSAEKAPQ